MIPIQVIHAKTGAPLVRRGWRAANWFGRAVGLLLSHLEPGEGLWLNPCSSIHTVGMCRSIDVVMLDAGHRVVHAETRLKPFRVLWKPGQGVKSVLELPAGSLATHGLTQGDQLLIMEGADAKA